MFKHLAASRHMHCSGYTMLQCVSIVSPRKASRTLQKLLARPFRLFLFAPADRHHKSVAQLLKEYDSAELAEWMVYLNREHYQKVIKDKLMTDEDRSLLIKNPVQGTDRWQTA